MVRNKAYRLVLVDRVFRIRFWDEYDSGWNSIFLRASSGNSFFRAVTSSCRKFISSFMQEESVTSIVRTADLIRTGLLFLAKNSPHASGQKARIQSSSLLCNLDSLRCRLDRICFACSIPRTCGYFIACTWPGERWSGCAHLRRFVFPGQLADHDPQTTNYIYIMQ